MPPSAEEADCDPAPWIADEVPAGAPLSVLPASAGLSAASLLPGSCCLEPVSALLLRSVEAAVPLVFVALSLLLQAADVNRRAKLNRRIA
ncbi:hypothetical protein ACFQ88_26630 [Paenibacillus sp. NPDC056579]|uniref:hypothetical protein n=1 Tax=Paenibacillus sp. NPDC056579 TaxID=3345871 RepID=UPI0036826A7A